MFTTQEEAQLLQNLLTDDDDWISRRLLEIHYDAQNASVARINTSSTPTNEDEVSKHEL